MRFAEYVSAATVVASAGITTVLAQDTASAAPRITNNPPGGVAFANIKSPDGAITGVVAASSGPNGQGTEFQINLNGNGAPVQGGPFMYHIHDKALASADDCGSAGAHLDPTKRGENPGCDATKPETCQVGDLSGKYGNCESLPGCSRVFVDEFTSLTPGNPAYFGDKSFVIHTENKTRIACANFVFGPHGGPQDAANGTATASGAAAASGSASSSAASVSASAFSSAASVGASASASASSAASSASGAASASSAASATSLSGLTSLTGFALSLLGLALW